MTGSKKRNGKPLALITLGDETRTASGWSKHRGLGPHRVQDRLVNGWHVQAAILGEIGETKAAAHERLQLEPVTPIRPMHAKRMQVAPLIEVDGVSMTATAWTREKGLGQSCISGRIKHGWDMRVAVLGLSGELKYDAHARLGIEPASRATTGRGASFANRPARKLASHEGAAPGNQIKRSWVTNPITRKKRTAIGTSLDRGTDHPFDVMMRHRLLKAEDERAIFRKLATARAELAADEKKLASLKKAKRAGVRAQIDAQKLKVEAGKRAVLKLRNEIVAKNMRLVALYAARFGADIDDRVMDGVEGLMIGVDRYEVERGWRFGTYASWWIKHCLRRNYDNARSLVRVPIHLQDSMKMGRVERDGVAIVCDWPVAMDAKLELSANDSKMTHHDVMPDEDAPQHDAQVARLRETARIAALAKRVLNERERYIVERRFGLDGADPETLIEIGNRLDGISRERVRQLERDSLHKLRQAMGGQRAAEAWL